MPTRVMPLRRIRIHQERYCDTWRVYCPCCWSFNGTGSPEPYGTFWGAVDWAVEHINLWHQRTGGWTAGPCCTDQSCPDCNPWPDTYPEAN